MPIYEYRCSACEHEFEALQKLSEPRLVECPACHAQTLVKKVSAAGFQLKGSGWYVTDFRNGSKKPAAAKGDEKAGAKDTADTPQAPAADAKSDAAPKPDTAAKSDSPAKSETASKPAAKAEAAPAKPSKPAATPSSGGTSS